MSLTRRSLARALALSPLAALAGRPAAAADRAVIDARIAVALARLKAEVPGSEVLMAEAEGLLLMPSVVKGGFLVGGAYGEGGLLLNLGERGYSKAVAYYSVAAASLGLQAGLQETAQALFFMTPKALAAFRTSDGWEVGADAEITMIDKAVALDLASTVLNRPVVAVVFGGSGLLVGASLEGAKYSPIVR